MNLLRHAIVLQTPTSKYSGYIFFDQWLGTINAHLHKKNSNYGLSRGALIQYSSHSSSVWHSAQAVEIIAIPQAWVVKNIWFLHHVLELIDFFVPRSHNSPDIFELMGLLYQPLHEEVDVSFFQKLFLCKFFILIGLYPEPRCVDDREFLSLVACGTNLDGRQVSDEQKYVFLEKKMIQWLRECILLHPHADRLKTMIMEPWCAYEKNNSTF
ncbi:MAG: hypothetical protein K2X90_04215 [Candidatus Babeliaceae bacterium]|nr:hypothetical protein [Candidatus Babeliaceae bacterium]